MSHVSKLATKLVDKVAVEATLKDMSSVSYLKIAQVGQLVSESAGWGNTVSGDFAGRIKLPNEVGDVGFALHRKSDEEAYELLTDTWGRNHDIVNEFMQSLVKKYALTAAVIAMATQGYGANQVYEDDQGRVHMTMRKVAY